MRGGGGRGAEGLGLGLLGWPGSWPGPSRTCSGQKMFKKFCDLWRGWLTAEGHSKFVCRGVKADSKVHKKEQF